MAGTVINALILVGNTGAGKSYVANRLFEQVGSSRQFVSRPTNYAVTSAIQTETINYKGKELTVVDCPGFFDNSSVNNQVKVDGENMCKLVKALEQCHNICAVLFLYTDRFSTPHRIWFDRIMGLLGEANRGNMLLVHNKMPEYDVELRAENAVDINRLLGGNVRQPYFWFSNNADDLQVTNLMDQISALPPFNLVGLKAPEVCYVETALGPEYKETISDETNDEGNMVEEVKDTSHAEMAEKWDRDNFFGALGLRGMPGAKKSVQVWVPSQAIEKKWVAKMVKRVTTGTYQDVYKVRFDGTKDFVEKKLLRKEEEKY